MVPMAAGIAETHAHDMGTHRGSRRQTRTEEDTSVNDKVLAAINGRWQTSKKIQASAQIKNQIIAILNNLYFNQQIERRNRNGNQYEYKLAPRRGR